MLPMDHGGGKTKAVTTDNAEEDKENIPFMSNRHQCKFCEKSFSRIEKLFKHVNSLHSKKKRAPIVETNQSQQSKTQVSDKALPHKCPLCKQPFATMVILMNHLTLAHYKQKFTCELCDLSFPSKDIFNLHLQVDHQKTKVVKEKVDKVEEVNVDLDEPYNATLQDLNHKLELWCKTVNPSVKWCEIDGQMFATALEYSKHLQVAHADSTIGDDFICDFVDCYCIFKSKPELKHHLSLVHLGVSFTCQLCPKTFPSPEIRSWHTQVDHLGVRFVCNLCKLDFKRRKNAFVHLLSHPETQRKGIKPLVLIPIRRTKNSKPAMRWTLPEQPTLPSSKPNPEVVDLDEVDLDEVDLVEDEEPMEQETITTTPQSQLLENPEKQALPQTMAVTSSTIPMNPQPFSTDQNMEQDPTLPSQQNQGKDDHNRHLCPHCSVTFANNSTLKNHIKAKHEQIKDIKCGYCDKYFSLTSSLYAHKKRRHLAEFNAERSVKGVHRINYPSMLPPHPLQMDSNYSIPKSSIPVAKKTVLENVSTSPQSQVPMPQKGKRDLDLEIQQLYDQLRVNAKPEAGKQGRAPRADHLENSLIFNCDYCPKTFSRSNSLYAHKKRKHPVNSINSNLIDTTNKKSLVQQSEMIHTMPAPIPVADNVATYEQFEGTNQYYSENCTGNFGHFPETNGTVNNINQSLHEQFQANYNYTYQSQQVDDVADFVLRSLNYKGF